MPMYTADWTSDFKVIKEKDMKRKLSFVLLLAIYGASARPREESQFCVDLHLFGWLL